jgi:DNA polymerase III epsilon subunit-like protein
MNEFFCVGDCETTGKDHRTYELIQICMLPLDDNLEPIGEDAFYYQIKADKPAVFDPEAKKTNNLDPMIGLERMEALRLFKIWIENQLRKRGVDTITPVGQNYDFDKEFIIDWMGFDEYYKAFHYNLRDTKKNGSYLADTIVPGLKTGLADQAEYFNIKNINHHDALNDCIVTAAIWKKQLELIK